QRTGEKGLHATTRVPTGRATCGLCARFSAGPPLPAITRAGPRSGVAGIPPPARSLESEAGKREQPPEGQASAALRAAHPGGAAEGGRLYARALGGRGSGICEAVRDSGVGRSR